MLPDTSTASIFPLNPLLDCPLNAMLPEINVLSIAPLGVVFTKRLTVDPLYIVKGPPR